MQVTGSDLDGIAIGSELFCPDTLFCCGYIFNLRLRREEACFWAETSLVGAGVPTTAKDTMVEFRDCSIGIYDRLGPNMDGPGVGLRILKHENPEP